MFMKTLNCAYELNRLNFLKIFFFVRNFVLLVDLQSTVSYAVCFFSRLIFFSFLGVDINVQISRFRFACQFRIKRAFSIISGIKK